jgi:hypothetical protein
MDASDLLPEYGIERNGSCGDCKCVSCGNVIRNPGGYTSQTFLIKVNQTFGGCYETRHDFVLCFNCADED